MIGVYKITNPEGKVYIGASTQIEKRFAHYKRDKFPKQRKLYESFLKFGSTNHTFDIIEECEKDILFEREYYYQALYESKTDKGLNLNTKNDFVNDIDFPVCENERNAGRKLAYGEETVLVQYKVPKSKKDEIKRKFRDILKDYETKNDLEFTELSCDCRMEGIIFRKDKSCRLTKTQHKF